MAVEPVLVAAIAAIPSTIAAFAALRGVSQNKELTKRTETNHGKRLGEHIEDVVEDTKTLKDGQEALFQLFIAHTEQDERNFSELREEIRRRG